MRAAMVFRESAGAHPALDDDRAGGHRRPARTGRCASLRIGRAGLTGAGVAGVADSALAAVAPAVAGRPAAG